MRTPAFAAIFAAAMTCLPTFAFADATAFIGVNANPERQVMRGFAGGFTMVIVGFEGEYANAGEDESAGVSSLMTVSGNVFLQTPIPVFGTRFYLTTGAGAYREELDAIDHSETNLVLNTGGGAKITLAGPLRLRLDYRVLKLQGDPVRPSTVHRWYAGINLAF
jgi:Outer membrane protein beta-barrel domain